MVELRRTGRTGRQPRLRGQRDTKQGELVRDLLANADGFRSAQALYAELHVSGAAIGLSTVYRHLQTLVETGEVDAIHDPGGQSIYRYCGVTRTGHQHHHLICRVCGRAEEVDGRVPDRWADEVARAHDYCDIARTIEVFGVCPDCQA